MIKTLKRYGYIYLYRAKLNIKTTLEYKADFLIAFFTNIPIQIIEFLFIWVVFQNIKSLDGWSFYEMALIYGTMICSKGIAEVFFDGFYDMSKYYIKDGGFDNILVQPINSLFNVISKTFYSGGESTVIIGISIIVTSVMNLNIEFGILQILMLIRIYYIWGIYFWRTYDNCNSFFILGSRIIRYNMDNIFYASICIISNWFIQYIY